MNGFFTWLRNKFAPASTAHESALQKTMREARARPTPPRPTPRKKPSPPETVEFNKEFSGRIEDGGPGKNVLIRNKYVREDSGTHDSLKILDDSVLETDDNDGLDPYNTGRFDRSKSWDFRSRE